MTALRISSPKKASARALSALSTMAEISGGVSDWFPIWSRITPFCSVSLNGK